MPTSLAHVLGLSILPNMETAPRYLTIQNAAVFCRARGRGEVCAIREELIELNRGRLTQCARGQQYEFYDRISQQPFHLQASTDPR